MARKHPMQPILKDDLGTVRFRKNAIVAFLVDYASQRDCNMNTLAIMPFSQDDWTQFYQLIGYSVSGFCDLSAPSESAKDKAYEAAAKLTKQ